MSKNRPTIRDVAALAHVSHQTVSRVINGTERVTAETRKRVEAAIEQLGYQVNEIARSMARGRSYNLACFSPSLIDYTFAQIIEAAEAEARQHGYFLFACAAPDESGFAELMEEMVAKGRVDGIVAINPYIDDRHAYMDAAFPTVLIGAKPRGDTYHTVYLDNEDGGFQAVSHLIELGHRSIGEITGPMAEDVAADRLKGSRRALEMHELDRNCSEVVVGDWSATSGYQGFQQLWQNCRPSAIFAQNDRMAIGVIRAARDAGLRVPEDLSVIGFDDMPLASYFDPPLTTMRQDMLENGRIAAQLLIRAIEDPGLPTQHVLLPTDIIVRGSTAPVG